MSAGSLELRDRLREARVLLIFTPDLAGDDPLAALEAALPFVDIVQVRVKASASRGGGPPQRASARETFRWTSEVRDLVRGAARGGPLVFVNDRVDVARALLGRGVHGVHVGDRDMPVEHVRDLCGDDTLIGLSTHSMADVVRAGETGADTLGFGPVFTTTTKGYGVPGLDPSAGRRQPMGPEAAWIAASAAHVPLFPIGGIDLTNAIELAQVGRCAVGSAILGARDPGAAARALRGLISDGAEEASHPRS